MIVEGEATFTLGDETLVVRGGEPPWSRRRTRRTRSRTPARDGCVTVDIHASPVFRTEWL